MECHVRSEVQGVYHVMQSTFLSFFLTGRLVSVILFCTDPYGVPVSNWPEVDDGVTYFDEISLDMAHW